MKMESIIEDLDYLWYLIKKRIRNTIYKLKHKKECKLVKAAFKGNMQLVAELLEAGININSKNEEGDTPLLVSLARLDSEMTEYLLKEGADANLQYVNPIVPTIYSPSLICAVRIWKPDMTALLLKYGADINAKDSDGFTALNMAVDLNYTDLVSILVQNGADLNIKTPTGKSTLELAKDRDRSKIVKILEKAGAKE